MKLFRLSFFLVLFYSIESDIIGVDTGLRPVSTQTTTDTNTNVGNGLKPFSSTTALTKSRIAFLVGINSYKATTSLKYAVGDSNSIEELLLKTGKYDKLIKLNDSGKIITTYDPKTDSYSSKNNPTIKPTKANIESTYEEVLADNPDMLLFYYSGHGFIEGEGGENYIAPKDVDVKFEKKKVGKEEVKIPVPLNGISLKKMGFDAAKVKKVVFLIDACRSPLPEEEEADVAPAKDAGKKELTAKDTKSAKEAKNTSSKDAKIEEEKEIIRKANFLREGELPRRVLEAEGITMLIGAAPEVSSLEDEDFKSGIFTHFLKKAFNGGVQEENQEEYITEENLSRYIEDRFKHYYELRKKESELAAEPKLYNLTFDRGKKGEILITYHRPIVGEQRIDKPVYFDEVREREVNGKLVYNEKGKREDLRFFAKDKQRDQFYPDSLNGVHKMKYAFENDNKGELKKFEAKQFNLENQEVFQFGTKLIPDKGWEYRGVYDVGNTVAHRKDLINQVPTMMQPVHTITQPQDTTTNKIRYERQIFDFNGNNILQEYFDNKGQLLEIDGVATVVRAWDFNGEKTLEETYDKDKKLIDKDGFARYTAVYKSKGNPISENWYGKNGEYANNKSGYARIHSIYDEQGRLTKKLFYDKDSKLVGDKWGVATYTYSYNPDCIRFYESQLFEKDEFGDEDPNKEQSRTEWTLGKYKLCLAEEIHTDKEDKPVGDEKRIYKKRRAFNAKGFLVSEENYRPDDERRHLENGVAKVVYSHDEEGNIISKKNFGEYVDPNTKEPTPVSDGNGVHEYRYTYLEYYKDGTPLLNECMYHRKDKGILIEPYGCALKIEHFGINGKPIEDKRDVFRTNIYYTGAYQVEANRHYYSINSKWLSVEKKSQTYNPFGSKTLDAGYETKKEKEFLVWKEEYKYDERNNMILLAYYETKEGKEYLVWKEEYKCDEKKNIILRKRYQNKDGKEVRKYEYKYDEKNNMILFAYYETKDAKEVPVSKEEYQYDENNNKTLSVYYEIKGGKEVSVSKKEYKYDGINKKILFVDYEMEEGKEILNSKEEYKYDERNNMILRAMYENKDGKEVLNSKEEFQYDERNNMILGAIYEKKDGKEVLVKRSEYKYDERNNMILRAMYEKKDGKEVLIWKTEYKFGNGNNKVLYAYYETKEGKEILVKRSEYKYDERDNKTLEEFYETKEGKEVLVEKTEYKYDKKNNKILEAKYERKGGELVPSYKNSFDYRSDVFAGAVSHYKPQINETEARFVKTRYSKDPKDESEKKSLNQKLEDLKKEFESKKKKYTLTEEKFGENEKLESASYKLLFFNPRGPAEKRLMRVDLDQFYRPVKVGFEEE